MMDAEWQADIDAAMAIQRRMAERVPPEQSGTLEYEVRDLARVLGLISGYLQMYDDIAATRAEMEREKARARKAGKGRRSRA